LRLLGEHFPLPLSFQSSSTELFFESRLLLLLTLSLLLTVTIGSMT
jgi:hypothetical protein